MQQQQSQREDPKDAPAAPDNQSKSYHNKKGETTLDSSEKTIRLVVQRFRKARLLVDESRIVQVGNDESDNVSASSSFSGVLVYASFAKSATQQNVMQAAKTILNLPILTRGHWGDGSEPRSVLEMAGGHGVAVVLVPQANLISKVKSQGKSIQYHGQIDKATGERLYEHLVDCIRAIALQHQCASRNEAPPKWLVEFDKNTAKKVEASVPPKQLFRDESLYSSWSDEGMPLTNQDGEPLTKSAIKKLKKQYEAHKKRHEKYLRTLQETRRHDESSCSALNTNREEALSWSMLDDAFIHVLAGSFGKRQGLELHSDMGPFCHVVDL